MNACFQLYMLVNYNYCLSFAIILFHYIYSNICMYNLLLQVLARVIAAVVKFNTDQTTKVLQKEEQRQSLVSFKLLC